MCQVPEVGTRVLHSRNRKKTVVTKWDEARESKREKAEKGSTQDKEGILSSVV